MLKPKTKFPYIFRPIKIGPVTAKNRIEVSPAEPFLATRDGLVTPEFVKFTGELAKAGAGIVTVGDSPINQPYADENHYVINMADEFVVQGLVKVVEEIHRYGALASLELNLRDHRFPADFTVDELKGIINDFASSAEKCKKAGFDMVMVHGGHGHTVAQFYSPHYNKRTDEYGAQNFENRSRFINELLDAVRAAIGPKMGLELRISGDEMISGEGNLGVEEICKLVQSIQHKIDLVHVSAGSLYELEAIGYTIQDTYKPRPTNKHLAAYIKARVDIPVTSVGSYNIPLAEEALADGAADVIAMIRPFIADHELVEKARAGKDDEIRPCLRCNVCTGDDPHGCPKPLRCSVNPRAGRQPEFMHIHKVTEPKKVAIIGGGCAGLEAARWLADRGHEPTIYERNSFLGGTLLDAGANEIKSDVRSYTDWSIRMVEKDERIKVELNCEMTAEKLAEINPDAAIIAVGSEDIVPKLPGIEKPNVVLATRVDYSPNIVGDKVVVVGAGSTGTETAAMLAKNGRDVTLIEMLSMEELFARGASGLAPAHGLAAKYGVKVQDKTALAEVVDDGIMVKDADGNISKIECDNVILALGLKPRAAVVDSLKDVIFDTYVVGDCTAPGGNIQRANREAFFAAMNI